MPPVGQVSGLGVAEAPHEEGDFSGVVPDDEEEGLQRLQQQGCAGHRGGHSPRCLHAGLVQRQHGPVLRRIHRHRRAPRQPAQLRVQEQPVVCGGDTGTWGTFGGMGDSGDPSG